METTWDDIVEELPDGWTLEITPYTIVGTPIRSARVTIKDKDDSVLVYKKLPVGELDEVLTRLVVMS